MPSIQRALISVHDKTGIVDFARELSKRKIDILSTGGTAKLLSESKIPVTEVSLYTGFPEMLDGRVKTLHPKIHGGILAVRDDSAHMTALSEHGIQPIDMVVINLYPFEKTVAKPGVAFSEAIENIDIGGPSLLRGAAKNHRHVAAVANPDRYPQILQELSANRGELSDALRYELAVEVFRITSQYDAAIASFLGKTDESPFPPILALTYKKAQELRYGENPHQGGAFYVEPGAKEPSVATAAQRNGKELSFNNILDLDAAFEIVKEFSAPAAVVVKHLNPCGAGVAGTLAAAYEKAYECDPVSAFGSIVGLNRIVDVETAEAIAQPNRFVEAVIAPGYDPEAFKILTTKPKWGKTLRVLDVGGHDGPLLQDKNAFQFKKVTGGLLVQNRNLVTLDEKQLKVATQRPPTSHEWEDLRFAWIIAKHVRSNAIVFSKGQAVVGVGAGQMSRVDSVRIAAQKAGGRAQGAVVASDAFFPFPDGVEEAVKAGATAFIQPGGSKQDAEVIAATNRFKAAMVMTGIRHFKH